MWNTTIGSLDIMMLIYFEDYITPQSTAKEINKSTEKKWCKCDYLIIKVNNYHKLLLGDKQNQDMLC